MASASVTIRALQRLLDSPRLFRLLQPPQHNSKTPAARHKVYSSSSTLSSSPSSLSESDVISTAMPALNLPVSIEDICPTTTTVPSPFASILDCPQVRIRDRAAVELKLKKMSVGGAEKLMVISDFDYTLSRFETPDGGRCWTTHGVFDNCADEVDPTLGDKMKALKNKYFPIEFSPDLTPEEKMPHMEKWWSTSHGHIVSAGFDRSTVRRFVANSNIVLRDGTDRMIRRLTDSRVPLVVFSAGIGNIIEMFFEHRYGKMPANAHIISNMMLFDEQDKVCGFSEPLIHTFCKNSSVIRKEESFFHEVAGRTNVILLGDSQGDIHMDVGVEKDGPTLKIGFLNANVEQNLEFYMEVYDIVLLLDQSMDVPSKIIDMITSSSSS